MSDRNILVVGGAGYIGGAFTDYWPSGTLVYDSLLFEDAYLKAIPFQYGDIRDREKLLPLLAEADTVVWLAALVGDGACAINEDLSWEINTGSVEWLARNFDKRIIFPSTCSVYGAQEGLLDEESPTNPLSVYAQTKLAAEAFLADKDAIIFRLGTIFGMSDSHSRIRLDLVVNRMTVNAVTQGKLSVFGGDQYRPLLHVRDVAAAMGQAVRHRATGVFNLSSENWKIIELAESVARITGADIEVTPTPFEDARNYRVSAEKARRVLSFDPRRTINDGVVELQRALREGRIKDVDDPRYTNEGYLQLNGVS